MVAIAELKPRRAAARAAFDQWRPMREDFYTYVLPYREGLNEQAQGQDRANLIYDHTPVMAAFRAAGRLQKNFNPVDGNLYELKPGPLVKQAYGEEAHKQLAAQLNQVTAICGSFNKTGEWDTAFAEMALDLQGGQGYMLMLEGKQSHLPARYISVPMDEVMIERGGYNDPTAIFWSRKYSKRQVMNMLPDGKFGEAFMNKKASDEVLLHMDTVYLEDKERWRTIWWIDGDDRQVFKEEYRTCPWLTPAYYRVPGETYGRGPANLAMPSIKTLNTAQRIQLMAAAIAMLGIYTARDDGVFNPDMSAIEPGAIWKVQSNGGMMGESVKRFPEPRIDLSQIVIDDLRLNIKAAMMDDALPPDTAAVRSPTEILERVKRLADDHMGAFGRMVREIIVPKAKRDMEIAYNKRLIPNNTPIDQLLVRVEVNSPVALAREAERVQNIVRWLEMVFAMFADQPGEIRYVAKVTEALIEIGRAMNVPEAFMVGETERQQMKEQDQQAQAAMMAAQMAAQGGAAQ
jgi:hypothetical protein